MPARRPLIAGNWKMNGRTADGLALAGALASLAKAGPRADVLICPPATLLAAVAAAVRGTAVMVGGQDCHANPSGAHTGDVSPEMLQDAGAAWVIVGHSERRSDHKETDAMVRAKAQAAWRAGLGAIVCIGETLAQREAGETLKVLESQVRGSVPAGATAENLVVAYEPVWAIGTGKTATSAEIGEAHRHIRTVLGNVTPHARGVRLQYGGSVKASNAKEILAIADVDGALVGGASLKAEEFWAIVAAVPA